LKKCKLIIATQRKNPADTIIYNSIQKLKKLYPKQIFYEFYLNNKVGLSELYQGELNKKQKVDYLIFVHDDVQINDMFFIEKLEKGFKFNDVIGVAGSAKINMSGMRLAWHNSDRKFWRGGCYHPYKHDLTQYYFNTFGPSGSKINVGCIDGLFIAVKLETCKNKELFTKIFLWDFYDFAFSIKCHFEKLKICVMPLTLCHFSHGEGLLKDEYKETQKIFIKWFEETEKFYDTITKTQEALLNEKN